MRSFNRPLSLLAFALITSFLVTDTNSLIHRSRILAKKGEGTRSNYTEIPDDQRESYILEHQNSSHNSDSKPQVMTRPLNTGQFYDGRNDHQMSQYDPYAQNQFHHQVVYQDRSVDSSSSHNQSEHKEAHVVINNQPNMLRKFTQKQPVDLESFSSSSDKQSNLSPSKSLIQSQIKQKGNNKNKATSKLFGTQDSFNSQESSSSKNNSI